MSYKRFMRKSIYCCFIVLFMSCAPTKIVVPLQEGQVQIGATLGRPKVNSGSIPLMGIYAAKAISNATTAYGAAQLSSALFGTIQLDGGVVKGLRPSRGFLPGLTYSYGSNLFVSTRDYATRIYPETGVNIFWQQGAHILNLSANTWVDPTWFLTEYNRGQILAPSLGAGYRLRYKWIEVQTEYKIVNPTREIMIPQAYVPSTFGLGGRGLYWGIALNF
jgi:hypothetical protein